MLKIKRFNTKGLAVDSILLIFVQVVTTAIGILITKLLSTQFSLREYGTYSQVNLLITTFRSLSIMGLTNAVNYFYNNTKDEQEQRRNVSTIFSIQYFIGLVCSILIIFFQGFIVGYFNNEQLRPILYIAAFIPVLQNLIPMLQVLFVSIGKAKFIAFRNLVISVLRFIFVIITCFITKNIITIFIMLFVLDLVQVIYFMMVFGKNKFRINLYETRLNLISKILSFSIPMAIYVLTNSLSRDIDKYIISMFTDTETFAIYSNAAKLLPFDIFTSSFITLLIPIITRQINSNNLQDARNTFKVYLRLGYLVTWIAASGAIVVSEELMVFLYDTKYLAGLSIFIIYIIVDMVRFANVTTILSGSGKTKTLMVLSVGALFVNAFFGIINFKLFGMIGPALTTLTVTIILTILLLHCGSKVLKTKIINLFKWKEILLITVEIVITGTAVHLLRNLLVSWNLNSTTVLFIIYGVYVGILFLINMKNIFGCLKEINSIKQ